jgi:hypothetical protein
MYLSTDPKSTSFMPVAMRLGCAFALISSLGCGSLLAAGGINLEIMASRVSSINGEFTGHAFMCIELLLNSGIKEDCYGFYPKNDNIKGYVGGPGVVNSEFQKNPSRFSRVDVSLSVPISDAQRRAILTLVNDWDSKNYDLTKQQCVDFVRSAATAGGLKVPARDASDFPVDLVAKLKKLNLP